VCVCVCVCAPRQNNVFIFVVLLFLMSFLLSAFYCVAVKLTCHMYMIACLKFCTKLHLYMTTLVC